MDAQSLLYKWNLGWKARRGLKLEIGAKQGRRAENTARSVYAPRAGRPALPSDDRREMGRRALRPYADHPRCWSGGTALRERTARKCAGDKAGPGAGQVVPRRGPIRYQLAIRGDRGGLYASRHVGRVRIRGVQRVVPAFGVRDGEMVCAVRRNEQVESLSENLRNESHVTTAFSAN